MSDLTRRQAFAAIGKFCAGVTVLSLWPKRARAEPVMLGVDPAVPGGDHSAEYSGPTPTDCMWLPAHVSWRGQEYFGPGWVNVKHYPWLKPSCVVHP